MFVGGYFWVTLYDTQPWGCVGHTKATRRCSPVLIHVDMYHLQQKSMVAMWELLVLISIGMVLGVAHATRKALQIWNSAY